MGVLNVVHNVGPALEADDQEDGCPGHTHVVERDGVLERVLIAGFAFGVILIPIDTIGIIGIVVAERLGLITADHMVVPGRG